MPKPIAKKQKLYLHPRLNHGRWITDCPDCNGAELAWRGVDFQCMSEMALFELGRAENPPPIYKLQWKSPKEEMQAIKILRLRKLENMNWAHNETINDLRAQNRKAGIE